MAGALLVLSIVVLLFVNGFINRSKPKIEGETTVGILENRVDIIRDDVGVPHIKAESDADLYRAQGYVQAQDRMFQMDLSRRQASGRLAEVVGEGAIDTDKFFRTFSLRNAAEKSWDEYSDEAKQVLEWHAEGINAYIREAKEEGTLSFEFSLLGYEPEEWTPTDSLAIGKYMAYDLGGNWSTLAIRHWVLNEFSENKARELFIEYPENAPSIIEANLKQPVKVAGDFKGAVIPPEFNGSNNWVLSGEKTESGKPLLADDPHLGLSTPSIWYQMHLESPEQNVSGVIFAGIPGIILGHNEHIAWGVTNVGPDVQDLYIETPNPKDSHQFLYEGKWEQAEVRDEPIKVKDGETEDFEVVVTRHGPVISGVLYEEENPGALFSMQWTALEPTLELQAVLDFNKASNWEEFETALEDFQAPAQNFVFASTDGTIAYKANGRIPIRKTGNGQLPVPGNSADYGWEGYVPFDELPRAINPESGFLATANNKVVDSSYKYHITNFWAQPYRYNRIAEVLEGKGNLTKEDMMALQMDQKNLYAAEFLGNMIAAVRSETDDFDELLEMLEQWDQIDSQEQAQPLIFHQWIRQLPITLLADEFPEDIFDMLPGKNHITDQMMRDAFAGREGAWVSEYGGVEKWLADSFAESIAETEEAFGNNYEDWSWGENHKLAFPHPLAGASPVFAHFLNPDPVPIGGSDITVQAAASDSSGNVNHGASWRFVADLSNLSSTYHIVGPGQSGHMKSPYFHNQVEDWIEGRYHETVLVGEVDGSSLILSPE
ncbi:penicillin acylase family protein [Planomicrobium sp. CPCC 101110]|uniref:penicillin acylase family protein n=1 Tax=Planomicrobium sp. CPCC 101110 TaxID=2599619 RepID=UPI0011B6209C|nr:penicillin acylase family protein [Planomicrobium sp. CPCC 101110]TWT24926.1 penicillin acylase family protein [Planomicrobium sp. CPCC 101110]